MQLVKTANHLIYSAEKGEPTHACIGTCRKVWWKSDLGGRIEAAARLECPQCKGPLLAEIPAGHYTVITREAGEIRKGGATVTNTGLKL